MQCLSSTLLLLLCMCRSCWCACTYPSALIDQWYSTSFGTLNFVSDQSFTGFTSALSSTPLTFTCHEASDTRYVSVSSYQLFTGVTVDAYLCMNLIQISTIKFYFTLDSNLDTNTGVRFYSPSTSGSTVSLATACTRTDTRSPGEYELLIKLDQIPSAVITCPTSLQSTFNVTMTTQNVDGCEDTKLEGSSGALVFNYSSCVTGHFNSGGYLQCLYTKTDTYTYVTTYNNDTTVGGSTYMFTCWVYEKHDATLRATESPSTCHLSQSPTSVNNPGVTYTMTDLLFTSDEKDYTVIIIVVVCCIVGTIIIVVIIVIVYFKFCKPKPKPQKVRKLKRQLSVTEYTPRSLGRGSSVETITEGKVHKQSTGEILTGVLAEKKQKHALENGDAYEPPKKEAWQKKWESDRNSVTPRLTQESLSRMNRSYVSNDDVRGFEKLSVSDLDKAYTMSTSLPESLDIILNQSPRQKPMPSTEDVDSTISKRYSDRSHAVPSLPASTGKFGGSPKIISTESLIVPNRELKLDTITENPLSRENTLVKEQKSSPSKPLIEHPNITRTAFSDVASTSNFGGSRSIASVGDVRFLSSFSNISSRNSHLSASNASIFDDPGWLMENKKAMADKQFESIKNLIPSLPKEKEKDVKWFLKTQKKPEVSREDIDYFKGKNKSYVGLNSSIRYGSGNSLDIIERAKTQIKRKKNRKPSPAIIRPVSPHFED